MGGHQGIRETAEDTLSKKRQRTEGGDPAEGENVEDDTEPDLEKLLQGDNFVAEEKQLEELARQRRLARKSRLQALELNQKSEREEEATNGNQPIKNEIPQENSTKGAAALVSKQGVEQKDEDEDDFDMFSSSVSPMSEILPIKTKSTANNNKTASNVDQQQDWDDMEGYYKATIGEIITMELMELTNGASNIQFRVSGVIGRGVFSSVLKCATESSNTSTPLPPQVALKCIRHNETMAKAANNEIRLLQRFTSSPGIIPLLLPTNNVPLDYRGHIVLVFPYVEYNLRDLLMKFGKGVGLALTAVRSYFGQLLSAATHLIQHRIIHSDLKPDNILVSQDFSTLQLCDFGSAVDSNETADMVTPYLVSRFYRAPEIILGLIPTYAIDLWSLAVTAAELFLGKVLFQGTTNNDMLNVMMQHMGPVSNRLIRQHLVQTKRFPLPAHFTQQAANYVFRQETVDPVSNQAVHKAVSLQGFSPALQSKLLKAKSAKDSRIMVLQFSDLLQKCLTLDPTRRIAVKAALQHDFFKEKPPPPPASKSK
jgi:serine/threonine-protein kinase PRP4